MSMTDNATWVEEYGDMLYRYAVVRVRDSSIAEDLVQETLLAALRDVDRFAAASSTGTWLIGILKHKIVDHFRRARFVIDLGGDEELFDETGHWRDDEAPGIWNKRTPENDLENKQLGAMLQNALAAIPAPLAAVFALHEIEGLGREEICELLELSDSNYWVMLHRARLRLRQEVAGRWTTGTNGEMSFAPAIQTA